MVGAAAPAKLESRGAEAVAWLYPGEAAPSGSQPPGPDIRLTPASLCITASPLPQYPVYYYRSPDDSVLIACSELAPLRRVAPAGGLDVGRIVALLASQDAEPGATVFRGLRRLRAGERVCADQHGIHFATSLPHAGGSYLRSRPRDLAVELRARVNAAVARAIDGASRIAVFAGGGLDSSGVLALALAQVRGARGKHLEAIAQLWTAPGDDGPYLAELERALGIVAVRVQARDAAPWFAQSLCIDAQPQSSGLACGEMQLWATGLARGAEVALSGHGGDLVFGGEVAFGPLVAPRSVFHAVINALRLQVPWRASSLHRLNYWVARPLLRAAAPASWLRARRRRRARRPWMTSRFLDALEPLIDVEPRATPVTPNEWMSFFCEHPRFAELSISWGQIASVTGTAPVDVYRDVEIVRFIAQTDPAVRSHGHLFRGLYRLAMHGILPEAVRLRPDKAIGEPLVGEAAVSADARGLLEDLSSLQHLASLGLVEPERFRAPFAAWLSNLLDGPRPIAEPTYEPWHSAWQLLSVEAFLRTSGRGPPP